MSVFSPPAGIGSEIGRGLAGTVCKSVAPKIFTPEKIVIPGRDPGIHVARAMPAAPWMPGSSPGMTALGGDSFGLAQIPSSEGSGEKSDVRH